jgi:hypothetical protein
VAVTDSVVGIYPQHQVTPIAGAIRRVAFVGFLGASIAPEKQQNPLRIAQVIQGSDLFRMRRGARAVPGRRGLRGILPPLASIKTMDLSTIYLEISPSVVKSALMYINPF